MRVYRHGPVLQLPLNAAFFCTVFDGIQLWQRRRRASVPHRGGPPGQYACLNTCADSCKLLGNEPQAFCWTEVDGPALVSGSSFSIILRLTEGSPGDEDLKSHEASSSGSLCSFKPQLLDSAVWFFLPKTRLCGHFMGSPEEVYFSTRTEEGGGVQLKHEKFDLFVLKQRNC